MNSNNTALLLIGFQNDYFAEDGILSQVVEASAKPILENTLDLIHQLQHTSVSIISTPIVFTPDYSELNAPVGILKTIKDVGAFKQGTEGAKTIDALQAFGNKIIEVPGKKGLNAFSNTELDQTLEKNNISNIAFAGVVTSICIDSTARSAHEKGYAVHILADCIGARSQVEQQFYLEQVFPLYAQVTHSQNFLKEVGGA